MDDFEAIVAGIPLEEVPTVTETLTLGNNTFIRYVKGPVVEWVTVKH